MSVSGPAIGTVDLASGGRIGLAAMPGRTGDFAADCARIIDWKPDIVVTLAEASELTKAGASDLQAMLRDENIQWMHFPIPDFGTPTTDQTKEWPMRARSLSKHLASGGSVLLHCQAGLGRSGMIGLRLMLDAGENAETALQRLRAARPGAVETEAQLAWAVNS